MGSICSWGKIDRNRCGDSNGHKPLTCARGIQGLESEGSIRNEPYKGVFVKGHSLEETRHAYLARAKLEALALKLVLEKMTDHDTQALQVLKRQGVENETKDMLSRFAPFIE